MQGDTRPILNTYGGLRIHLIIIFLVFRNPKGKTRKNGINSGHTCPHDMRGEDREIERERRGEGVGYPEPFI